MKNMINYVYIYTQQLISPIILEIFHLNQNLPRSTGQVDAGQSTPGAMGFVGGKPVVGRTRSLGKGGNGWVRGAMVG